MKVARLFFFFFFFGRGTIRYSVYILFMYDDQILGFCELVYYVGIVFFSSASVPWRRRREKKKAKKKTTTTNNSSSTAATEVSACQYVVLTPTLHT